MSDFIDISMLGDKELESKLKNIDFKLQKKIVRSSLVKSMLPVRNKAIALAPVKTGKMKSSIKRKTRTKRGITRVSIVTGTAEELGIEGKYYYPAAIEYGTRHQPAKSFMRKALSDLKDSVLKNIAAHIRAGIKKEL